ncbi:hypothetical protein BGZ46_005654, partial [Entomortierella lignicola]
QIHALTPPNHADAENLATVQKEMVQVAEEINEIKKRKDIVEKIVGPKKKHDSDIVYVISHGFSKKFSRTTQQLRNAVGGDVTVDILFEALLERFNLQQRLAREFANYIQTWLVSIKQFFDMQESFAMTLRDIYVMVPIHRNNENQAIHLVTEFHRKLSHFSKSIGRELETRLKKTVYKSVENFLKLFSGPLQVMKKREKKLLDYDTVRRMKEKEETTSRIRRVYSEYCKRQEASAQHLLELDNRKELKPFFDACTEKCKGRTTTWDLASMIIKPVQRVLKYPLLIN